MNLHPALWSAAMRARPGRPFVRKDPVRPYVGCATCQSSRVLASMRQIVAVGFGSAVVTIDDKLAVDGEQDPHGISIADVERVAARHPRHDWRICLHGPLRTVEYQRQGRRRWVCVRTDEGFA